MIVDWRILPGRMREATDDKIRISCFQTADMVQDREDIKESQFVYRVRLIRSDFSDHFDKIRCSGLQRSVMLGILD